MPARCWSTGAYLCFLPTNASDLPTHTYTHTSCRIGHSIVTYTNLVNNCCLLITIKRTLLTLSIDLRHGPCFDAKA
ncbi:hypothetical protein K523DRAFT_166318 [Schizophyllum commune Tattone D]|nr:hypothetical protein K523DRAFT_166318 [Schizophyllum commune Tattone D]